MHSHAERGNEVKQISKYLGEYEAFKEEMRNPFIASLSVDHLPEEDKTEIFTQLLAIHLEEPMVEPDRLVP